MEAAQLRDDLERARKSERSHYLGWMIGVSPVGLLLLVGWMMEGWLTRIGSVGLLLAVAVQWRRWKRAEREVQRLEALLEGLELPPIGPGPDADQGSTP